MSLYQFKCIYIGHKQANGTFKEKPEIISADRIAEIEDTINEQPQETRELSLEEFMAMNSDKIKK